jgi:hypothetical protein
MSNINMPIARKQGRVGFFMRQLVCSIGGAIKVVATTSTKS